MKRCPLIGRSTCGMLGTIRSCYLRRIDLNELAWAVEHEFDWPMSYNIGKFIRNWKGKGKK